MEWIKKHLKLVIPLAIVALFMLAGLFVWQYQISVTNEGEAWQERIELAHQQAQNSLSTCIDSGRTAAQVTEREFEAIEGILVETASARYAGEAGEALDTTEAVGRGFAFSGVFEAYPNIDQSSWQSLQSTVVGCREKFEGSQNRLFYEANQFDTWTLRDNVFNQGIKNNFPTDELEVVDASSGELLTGPDALEYLTRVIVVEEASTAYGSGTLEEQDLFGEE